MVAGRAHRGRAGPDPVPDEPAEVAERAEEARRVRRAVGRLPAGQRAAVVLFYLVGMAHREVAAALGIGVGAVKTRLHKGRAALREELATWEREEHMATTTTGPVTMRVTEVRRQPQEAERPEKTAILLTEEAGSGGSRSGWGRSRPSRSPSPSRAPRCPGRWPTSS